MAQTKKANNYISLQDATRYCPYSQEYLSLRARQGKLKAEKFGRNWVTKREWLKKYMAGAEEYNNNLEILRIKNLKKVKKIKPIKVRKVKEEIWPPANLPIGEFDEREFSEVRLPQIKKPTLGLRFAFATALVFVLIIGVGILVLPNFVKQNLRELGKSFLTNVFQQTSPYVKRIGKAGNIIIEKTVRNINQSFTAVFEDISYLSENTYINGVSVKDISQGTSETFKEYFQWLSSNIKTHAVALRNTIANSEFAQSFTVSIKSIRRYLLHLD